MLCDVGFLLGLEVPVMVGTIGFLNVSDMEYPALRRDVLTHIRGVISDFHVTLDTLLDLDAMVEDTG